MFNFIQAEFLKLKRSRIFTLSILGAMAPSLLMFLALLVYNSQNSSSLPADEFLNFIPFYYLLLIGVMLFSLIIAHLFTREYKEHTLKSILTSPISKTHYVMGKFVMFIIWALILAVVAFVSAIVLGSLGGMEGLTLDMAIDTLTQLLVGSILLAIAMTPFAFISLLFKNTIPVVIAGVVVSLSNSIVYGQEQSPLSPWCSPLLYSANELTNYSYGVQTPLLIIGITCLIGILLAIIYFNKTDVTL